MAELSGLKVVMTSAAGGVKVGKRVGKTGELNAASKVGSISKISVAAGVGVGGETNAGNGPVFTIFTKGA